MRLRSRGDRSGRFHRSSRRGPCVYRSSAGETSAHPQASALAAAPPILACPLAWSAWATEETSKASDAMTAAKTFHFLSPLAWVSRTAPLRVALPNALAPAESGSTERYRQYDQATASQISSGYGKYGPACLFRQLLSSKFFRPRTRHHEPFLESFRSLSTCRQTFCLEFSR